MKITILIGSLALLLAACGEKPQDVSAGKKPDVPNWQGTDNAYVAPGFKADFVLLDARHPAMTPLREPVRSLVYVAGDRAVNDVFVDGNQVVKNGKCLTIDLQAASEALQEAQQRSLKKVSKLDWNGRSADELAPMAYRTVDRLN